MSRSTSPQILDQTLSKTGGAPFVDHKHPGDQKQTVSKVSYLRAVSPSNQESIIKKPVSKNHRADALNNSNISNQGAQQRYKNGGQPGSNQHTSGQTSNVLSSTNANNRVSMDSGIVDIHTKGQSSGIQHYNYSKRQNAMNKQKLGAGGRNSNVRSSSSNNKDINLTQDSGHHTSKNKQGKGQNALYNEQNKITIDKLKEGEIFQQDMDNIVKIISGVEKNMNMHKLNQQFKKSHHPHKKGGIGYDSSNQSSMKQMMMNTQSLGGGSQYKSLLKNNMAQNYHQPSMGGSNNRQNSKGKLQKAGGPSTLNNQDMNLVEELDDTQLSDGDMVTNYAINSHQSKKQRSSNRISGIGVNQQPYQSSSKKLIRNTSQGYNSRMVNAQQNQQMETTNSNSREGRTTTQAAFQSVNVSKDLKYMNYNQQMKKRPLTTKKKKNYNPTATAQVLPNRLEAMSEQLNQIDENPGMTSQNQIQSLNQGGVGQNQTAQQQMLQTTPANLQASQNKNFVNRARHYQFLSSGSNCNLSQNTMQTSLYNYNTLSQQNANQNIPQNTLQQQNTQNPNSVVKLSNNFFKQRQRQGLKSARADQRGNNFTSNQQSYHLRKGQGSGQYGNQDNQMLNTHTLPANQLQTNLQTGTTTHTAMTYNQKQQKNAQSQKQQYYAVHTKQGASRGGAQYSQQRVKQMPTSSAPKIGNLLKNLRSSDQLNNGNGGHAAATLDNPLGCEQQDAQQQQVQQREQVEAMGIKDKQDDDHQMQPNAINQDHDGAKQALHRIDESQNSHGQAQRAGVNVHVSELESNAVGGINEVNNPDTINENQFKPMSSIGYTIKTSPERNDPNTLHLLSQSQAHAQAQQPMFSSKLLSKEVVNRKVIMQVNEFVPHYMRIPKKIENQDIKRFEQDYTGPNQAISDHLIQFDRELINILQNRHENFFYHFEMAYGQTHDLEKLLQNWNCEEIQSLSYQIFIEDIFKLRSQFTSSLQQLQQDNVDLQEKFAQERNFFLDKTQKETTTEENLHKMIANLKKQLEQERKYNQDILVQEQVSRMCQKAYFSYKHLQMMQINRDQQKMPSLIKNLSLVFKDRKQRNHDGVNSGKSSLHMSSKKNQEVDDGENTEEKLEESQKELLQKIESLKKDVEDKKHEYESLEWQLNYEKKLSAQMTNMLENKVSELLAETNQLKVDIELQKSLNKKVQDQNTIENLEITKLHEDIKYKDNLIKSLELQIQELNIKGGDVNTVDYQSLKAQLDINISENKSKTQEIKQLEKELQINIEVLKDIVNKVQIIERFSVQKQRHFEDLMDQKCNQLEKRIDSVTQVFSDTLLYSNKTYFIEELNRLKSQGASLRQAVKLKDQQILSLDEELGLYKKDQKIALIKHRSGNDDIYVSQSNTRENTSAIYQQTTKVLPTENVQEIFELKDDTQTPKNRQSPSQKDSSSRKQGQTLRHSQQSLNGIQTDEEELINQQNVSPNHLAKQLQYQVNSALNQEEDDHSESDNQDGQNESILNPKQHHSMSMSSSHLSQHDLQQQHQQSDTELRQEQEVHQMYGQNQIIDDDEEEQHQNEDSLVGRAHNQIDQIQQSVQQIDKDVDQDQLDMISEDDNQTSQQPQGNQQVKKPSLTTSPIQQIQTVSPDSDLLTNIQAVNNLQVNQLNQESNQNLTMNNIGSQYELQESDRQKEIEQQREQKRKQEEIQREQRNLNRAKMHHDTQAQVNGSLGYYQNGGDLQGHNDHGDQY